MVFMTMKKKKGHVVGWRPFWLIGRLEAVVAVRMAFPTPVKGGSGGVLAASSDGELL
ncbi:hypothetical protein SESBI_41402 [Sesbania bispinosa]|nr:hypothetical protein SESBI_41402 [Sesbania bispinosa]